MRFIVKPSFHWMLAFAMKISGGIVILDLIILSVLWVLKILYLFTLILIYEAIFILIIGIFQILGSYIYRKDSIPYRMGFRTGWFDFEKFTKLKPEERQRYRQEGIIMVIIGLVLFFGTVIAHFYILIYSQDFLLNLV
jgi:hypothetical protein